MARVIRGDFRQGRQARKDTDRQREIPDYRLFFSVNFSDPPIWRRVLISGKCSLADLHRVIQASFGWSSSADHQFLVGKIFYRPISPLPGRVEYNRDDGCRDETAVTLAELEEGMSFLFTYLYDGGQGWEVELTLEEVISSPSSTCPRVVDGERAGPPEVVGDIHSYQDLLYTWESDPVRRSTGQPMLRDDPAFSPETWDREGINQHLAHIFPSR
ncbi:plasmid pRiA4b ORF-3 family protein [Desulfofustis limnaeus]|jgi:hypothetical protein|uniref:Plasmid pRiA4b Orf3-like domain-containing protein n=1 Tax=Desulfofustis limnaeus TaxID=2740163 RepID=A0ABN6M7V9_9BACT|nr:plasmid pRiA4b ORF-3 family protein [Desulfofustis limnaeus]MDX9894023.1 plasmid pRiA4b ORF-3 family protein [Desulfofustis sp.]BDD88968.1 hypothetical protein DPPLL_33330 [Desulfofustis limnaeus]